MLLKCNNVSSKINFKIAIISTLILTQIFLISHALSLSPTIIWLIMLLCGLPLTLVCAELVVHKTHLRYVNMTVIMFATGGLGMSFGFLVDMNGLGLHGLLSICHMDHTTITSFLNFDILWFKIQSMKWMYIGMFVSGNVGMLLFDTLQRPLLPSTHISDIYDYVACNLGMFIGMLLGDILSIPFIMDLNPLWGILTMIVFMILGMILGMIALLYLSLYIKITFLTKTLHAP
jgi:hypothetical protein